MCLVGERGDSPILAANKLYFAVLLTQVGDWVFEEHRVQPQVGADEWHVAEHCSECVQTRLPLNEMVWIIPR